MNKKILLSLAAASLVAACGDDEAGASPSYLTLQGNGNAGAGAVFNAAHAGQTVRAALLDGTTVLDIQKTTVAAVGTDPAFSVTFAPAIDLAKPYTVHYWIDSNFGLTAPAGAGECNPKATDHQWSIAVPAGQTTVKELHLPASTADVCPTFTFPLTFRADGTFNGPHAGQPFKAALVRGSETTALQVVSGTVAASGTPALSVTFTPELVIGEVYSVKLWIDFNSNGTCEAPGTDHQWSVNIPTSLGSPETFTYGPHNTTFTNVCSFVP